MITKVGNYRASGIPDHGVSETKNGFPQFVALLRAEEFFDTDLNQWVALDTGEEQMGFFCLFDSNNNATLNKNQVQKVTGWDGRSFGTLAAMDLTGTPVQFRVESSINPGTGQANLQISWIDEYEAVPGTKVRKLDADALKGLDAKYGAALKSAAGPAKPASAPTTTPTATVSPETTQPKRGPGRPKGAGKGGSATKLATATAPAVTEEIVADPTPVTAAPPTISPSRPIPPPRAKTVTVPGVTKEQAWEACYQSKTASVTDDKLSSSWIEAIEAIAPGVEDENITKEQWYEVAEAVKKLISAS